MHASSQTLQVSEGERKNGTEGQYQSLETNPAGYQNFHKWPQTEFLGFRFFVHNFQLLLYKIFQLFSNKIIEQNAEGSQDISTIAWHNQKVTETNTNREIRLVYNLHGSIKKVQCIFPYSYTTYFVSSVSVSYWYSYNTWIFQSRCFKNTVWPWPQGFKYARGYNLKLLFLWMKFSKVFNQHTKLFGCWQDSVLTSRLRVHLNKTELYDSSSFKGWGHWMCPKKSITFQDRK